MTLKELSSRLYSLAVFRGLLRDPVMEALAEKYEGKAIVGKVNTDEEGELAMRYTVMNIPTVIFFKDGKEIDRKVGVMPPDAFIQVLEQNL